MAQWIMHRPPRHSHEAEIRTAEFLKEPDALSDEFEHYMWIMATSRARQLLAMVNGVGGEGVDSNFPLVDRPL